MLRTMPTANVTARIAPTTTKGQFVRGLSSLENGFSALFAII